MEGETGLRPRRHIVLTADESSVAMADDEADGNLVR
jgi:hypothetical protein